MRPKIIEWVAYLLLSPASLVLRARQGNQSVTTGSGSSGDGGATLSADNTFTNNSRFKGPDPFRDVTAYGASGSKQTTTTGASFTSGSTTLTLAAALDFKNE